VEVEGGDYLYYSPTNPNYFCVHPATQSAQPIVGVVPRYLPPALGFPIKESIAVLTGKLLLPSYRISTPRVSCPL
jgi:hypothetical protein